ncbi:MAG: hypothetical protein AB2421_20415 [Thermotaleaceae bacterium]
MLIKVSEKPVISMDTGKTLGALKGLVYINNKVTFLYCNLSEKYFYIPVKEACIGSDAIMLKTFEDINMVYMDETTKVYTENGKEIGTVTSVEIDDFFHIAGIHVNELFIEIDKVLHMDSIIIVELDKVHAKEALPRSSDVVDTFGKDVYDNPYNEQQANFINYDLIVETELHSLEESNAHPIDGVNTTEDSKESEIQQKDTQEELTIVIDPRYKHLCGKKLLEDITIVDKSYQKGLLIDASLIQLAISHNSIVKLIMSTED